MLFTLVNEDCTSSIQHMIVQSKAVFCYGLTSNEGAHSIYDCGYTHLVKFAHACGYYSRVATIRGATSIRINTVADNLCRKNLGRLGNGLWYCCV